MLILACLGLALAQEPVPAPAPEPAAESVPATVESVDDERPEAWAALPAQELLDAAIEHRSLGDVAGARARLQSLQARGELPVLVRYHLAVCEEVEERYLEARDGYQALIDAFPDEPLANDARYRLAIVLEDLGEHKQADRVVKALQRGGRSWKERDRLSIALVRGSSELQSGRAGKGIRRIQDALAPLEGTDQITWARARGRLALAQALLDQAAQVEMTNGGQAKKALVARVSLLQQAMDQVIAISQLKEPEFALAGLLALGDGYASLHHDLIAAPPPRGLDADQLAIFDQELRQQIDILQVKAWRLYDQGVSLATRMRWQGHVALDLRQRRDALGPLATGGAPAPEPDPAPTSVPDPG